MREIQVSQKFNTKSNIYVSFLQLYLYNNSLKIKLITNFYVYLWTDKVKQIKEKTNLNEYNNIYIVDIFCNTHFIYIDKNDLHVNMLINFLLIIVA